MGAGWLWALAGRGEDVFGTLGSRHLLDLFLRTFFGDVCQSGPGVSFPNVGQGLVALLTLAPGLLVIWSPGPLVPWSSGPLVPWSSGPLVPWSSAPAVLGSRGLWSSGPVVSRCRGHLIVSM